MTVADVIAGRADWAVECGDCLALLSTLPDACVDAVVTDPPYNVGFRYGLTDDRRTDYAAWCHLWITQLRRVCRGPIAVSVGLANLSMWARTSPPDWWLAWWKPAAMGRCVVGFNNWEPIALYGRPVEVGCDVIRATIRPDDSLKGHPCPKPLDWAVGQVRMLSHRDDTVLDPFAGSGTTGVACLRGGRRFIGFDVEPAYCDLARRRLGVAPPLWAHAGAAEPGLFDPPPAEVTP